MKTLALVLLAASTAFADDWFIAPTAGVAFPNASAITYHGMSGTVDYRAGYSEGMEAGRYIGPFKLYLSYDHTSFKARDLTLQTPYGKVSQADSDNTDQHTILANADWYSSRSYLGFKPYLGAGAGVSVTKEASTVCEVRAGIERRIAGFEMAVGYAYRFAQGQERFGLKSDGTYSISLNRPDEQIVTVSFGRKF